MQEDKIGYAGGGNLYAYVGGRPLEARDPNGRMPVYESYAPPDGWYQNPRRDMCPTSNFDCNFSGSVLNEIYRGLGVMDQMARHAIEQRLRYPARGLDAFERVVLNEMCQHIDCDAVSVVEDGHPLLYLVPGVTTGNTIFIRSDMYSISLLAHELTHVGQYQFGGPLNYYFQVLGRAVRDIFVDVYRVDYPLTRSWAGYGMEQQGRLVQHCLAGVAQACSVTPYYR